MIRPTLLTCAVGLLLLCPAIAGAGEGKVCRGNADCGDERQFCQKFLGDCDGQGICSPRPEICLMVQQSVCGCDGQSYLNNCWAQLAGVSPAYCGEDCGEPADGETPKLPEMEVKEPIAEAPSLAGRAPVYYTNCSWSRWVNSYDGLMNYVCPGRKMMAGAYSIHNNHKEDRIFQFYCCDLFVKN